MRIAVVSFVVFGLVGCTANPQKQFARDAANAMSSSPATLTVVGSITMEGSGTVYDPASGAKYAVKSFQRVLNFKRGGQWRQEEERVAETHKDEGAKAAASKVSAAKSNAAPQIVVRGVYGKTAFNVNAEGTAASLSDQDVRDRREEIYQYPIGFLEAAFARNSKLGNQRTEGNEDAVDLTVDGITYTLYTDTGTKLPTRIVSKTRNGESTLETSFDKYLKLRGYTLPSHIVMKVDQMVTADLKIDRQTLSVDTVRLPVPAGIKVEAPAGRGRGAEAAAAF